VVINCAAWTAVEAAEREPAGCLRMNADAVASLADACDAVGTLFVQVGADYVFGADRQRATPYTERDAIGPLNEYRPQQGARRGPCPAERSASRGSGVWPLFGCVRAGPRSEFSRHDARAGSRAAGTRRGGRPGVHSSYVPHVATGILRLIECGAEGTVHLTNAGATSWHGLACHLFREAGMETVVKPIRTAEYPSLAERPAWSVLDTAAFAAATGTALPDWQAGVADYWAATAAWSPSRS